MLEDLDDQARLKMEDELKKRESTLVSGVLLILLSCYQ